MGCIKVSNSNSGVLIWNDKGRNPQNNVYRQHNKNCQDIFRKNIFIVVGKKYEQKAHIGEDIKDRFCDGFWLD